MISDIIETVIDCAAVLLVVAIVVAHCMPEPQPACRSTCSPGTGGSELRRDGAAAWCQR